MGRVEGKVVLITGAARGQGRSHAVKLAEEGADIIAVDVCDDIDSVRPFYPGTSREDLDETVRQVKALNRRIVSAEADVRDPDALQRAVDDGVAQLGRLDTVVANAGIFTFGQDTHKLTEQGWQELMDINVTGVWHTCKAAVPHLNDAASVMLISSLAGFKGLANVAAYTTTKHGIAGLMKALASELGPRRIRVNTVHPNAIDTPMIQNNEVCLSL